ncbi:MAG: T9SS type A sorting domain-containing protein, partial [Flavobacteriales bacterium]|nr:T9SS type A sorting domain-containing protein [Flavobacteriales bacterium]
GGPTNNGVYPLVFTVDARTAGSDNATINIFIPAGTWVSNIDPGMGGGPLYLLDTLVVPSDYANISTSIAGDSNIEPGTQYTYSVPQDPNVTYTWNATNGNIISGQGTHEVVIEWSGNGNVDVLLVDGGCQGVDDLDVTAIPTGLDEVASINASLYPNPNNGIFNLQLDNSGGLTVRVLDVSGKVLKSQQLSGNTVYTLDMQTAPVGVYIVELESAEGRTFKRLIKH